MLLQVPGASEAHLADRTSKRPLKIMDMLVQSQAGLLAERLVTDRTDVHSAIVDGRLLVEGRI